jgi:copper homeostasis protein CutC
MPGSGIKPENIRSLAQKTGAKEYHGALRNSIASDMGYHNPVFGAVADNNNAWINAEEVKALRAALEEGKAQR